MGTTISNEYHLNDNLVTFRSANNLIFAKSSGTVDGYTVQIDDVTYPFDKISVFGDNRLRVHALSGVNFKSPKDQVIILRSNKEPNKSLKIEVTVFDPSCDCVLTSNTPMGPQTVTCTLPILKYGGNTFHYEATISFAGKDTLFDSRKTIHPLYEWSTDERNSVYKRTITIPSLGTEERFMAKFVAPVVGDITPESPHVGLPGEDIQNTFVFQPPTLFRRASGYRMASPKVARK
jgi:hypothetical protein